MKISRKLLTFLLLALVLLPISCGKKRTSNFNEKNLETKNTELNIKTIENTYGNNKENVETENTELNIENAENTSDNNEGNAETENTELNIENAENKNTSDNNKKNTETANTELNIEKEVHPEDFLCKIDEPKYFIIATMSYDMPDFTEKIKSAPKNKVISFFNDNVPFFDNDEDKIQILMNDAIVKFQNYIDDMVGVSFIDRSKIAQIEKEHEFQLSDWSNAKKTAEIGNALNANILLFLENFSYLKRNGGEYRFIANLVDINSMQKTSHSIVYSGKNLKIAPETLEGINFRNFQKISSIKNPFEDEMKLSITKPIRVAFSKMIKQNVSPLRSTKKIDLSKTNEYNPETFILDSNTKSFTYTSFYIDGFDSITLKKGEAVKSGTYNFIPCDQYITKIENQFYTDGKIGKFSIKIDNSTDNTFESYDVFTTDYYEYYFKFGSSELKDSLVNYYFQIIKN